MMGLKLPEKRLGSISSGFLSTRRGFHEKTGERGFFVNYSGDLRGRFGVGAGTEAVDFQLVAGALDFAELREAVYGAGQSPA
jgi:hypothetical protein